MDSSIMKIPLEMEKEMALSLSRPAPRLEIG
jgi:hypothetical protein